MVNAGAQEGRPAVRALPGAAAEEGRAAVRAMPGAAAEEGRAAVRAMPGHAAQDGQAAVELVALLPCIAALFAAVWQLALAGHSVWAAATAARAAARAHAVGADPRVAARHHLPRTLERGLQVTTAGGGRVHVSLRIPPLPGLPSPGRTRATATFAPQ